MINLPLRRIQSLVAVAEAGSFHGAASRLGISQPAVSAHIRALEEQFSVPLVQRTTRQVALTPEGRTFVARAQRAFGDLELAARDLRDLSTAQHGEVTIACIPPLVSLIMPRLIRTHLTTHPSIKIRLRDVISTQIDGLLARGEADFGVGPQLAGSALAFEALRRDDFVAVVPRGHPLARRREATLADIVAYPIIANSRDTNARQTFERALQRLPNPVRPQFELTHYFSIGRFVEAGLGITVLPRMAFDNLVNERLVALDIRSPRLWREIGLMWRRGYRPSPAAAAFIAALRRRLAPT